MSNVNIALNESVGDYDFDQQAFTYLRVARITTALVSMVFDFISMVVFLYLVIYHWSKVNRVSFRCAAFCCIAHLIENVFFVIMVKVKGPSKFCAGIAFVAQYFAILGVTFLTLIGINLVLVYVVNFRNRHVLEYYYYPASIIYSAVGLIGPVVHYFTGSRKSGVSSQDTCWYIYVMKSRFGNALNYMWFYGFIFFATIVALLCSNIAIVKLLKDHKVLTKLFKSRRQREQQQQITFEPVISQVIVRCLLYPIVPFVCYVCGFVMQCVITSSDEYPQFSLVMANTILSGLIGVFVALIFLNDPVITQACSQWYNDWFHKHILEYVTVETEDSYIIRVFCDSGVSRTNRRPIILASFPPTKASLKTKAKYLISLLWCCCNYKRKKKRAMNRSNEMLHDNGNRNNLVLGTDCPDTIHALRQNSNSDNPANRLQRIPMRRLNLSRSTVIKYMENSQFTPYIIIQRSFSSQNVLTEELLNGYFLISEEESGMANYILTPYSSTKYSKFIHWVFNGALGNALRKKANVLNEVTIVYEPLPDKHYPYHSSAQNPSDPAEEEL